METVDVTFVIRVSKYNISSLPRQQLLYCAFFLKMCINKLLIIAHTSFNENEI